MYFIYTFLFTAGIVLTLPYYFLRFRRYFPTLSDRLGFLKLPQLNRSIWIHAVSVGEVKAVETLIERLHAQFSSRPIVVSTATPAGQQLARSRSDIIDHAFYFPLDLPGCIKRVLDRLRPEIVIIAETEIWPNFLRMCRQRSVPVMMVNGRISDRSFARYRLVRGWLQRVLADYTMIGMQSETDRMRIEALGGDPDKVTVLGNLKYDVAATSRPLDAALTRYLRLRTPVWIAASTMPGEEEVILNAFRELQQKFPTLRLVIAPRHPERFDSVESLVRGRDHSYVRRTQLGRDADILLLDTIGELASAFEHAHVVFMGGTLVPKGGHNVLEPARYRNPIVFGPHMENFRDIARLFLEGRAAVQIKSAAELADTIDKILSNPKFAADLGKNARNLVDQNSGATDRVLTLLRLTEALQ